VPTEVAHLPQVPAPRDALKPACHAPPRPSRCTCAVHPSGPPVRPWPCPYTRRPRSAIPRRHRRCQRHERMSRPYLRLLLPLRVRVPSRPAAIAAPRQARHSASIPSQPTTSDSSPRSCWSSSPCVFPGKRRRPAELHAAATGAAQRCRPSQPASLRSRLRPQQGRR
jgi:hypothetical protein